MRASHPSPRQRSALPPRSPPAQVVVVGLLSSCFLIVLEAIGLAAGTFLRRADDVLAPEVSGNASSPSPSSANPPADDEGDGAVEHAMLGLWAKNHEPWLRQEVENGFLNRPPKKIWEARWKNITGVKATGRGGGGGGAAAMESANAAACKTPILSTMK